MASPAAGHGDQVVLAGGRLSVPLHLDQGGLADIDHGRPRQVRGGDLPRTHSSPASLAVPGAAACALAIRPASSVMAASTCGPGSWPIRSGSGAGTCSGSRLSWTGCTIILPGRRVSCSLLPVTRVPGVKRRNQHRQVQQVRHRAQRPRPVPACAPAACSRSVHAAGTSRLDPSGSTTSNSRRPMPAHAAQHRQLHGPRTGAGPGKPHRARQRGGHRPASVTTCTRRPAAWHTAWAARAAFAASMHSAASRRSTGMPPAMLAATSSTCRSPSEHGSTPCTASAAAAKSTAATSGPGTSHRLDRDLQEILPQQPRAVRDQQLSGRLGGQPPLRPCPDRPGKVIEARSKAGSPFRRFRIRS